MILSQVGANSEDFRAVLTSPFLHKNVTINSYDSFNKPQPLESTLSRDDLPDAECVNTNKIQIKKQNVGIIHYSKDSADTVKNMIQNGYTTKNALDTQKAIRAYGLNAINTNGGVYAISNSTYEV